MDSVTIPALQQMKHDGRKIVGVVAWDFQIAQIADRIGVEIVSVGDSVGINLWGHASPLDVTVDEMLIVCKAVRRGTRRALVSCDLPYGPAQESPDAALRAASRLMQDASADMPRLAESMPRRSICCPARSRKRPRSASASCHPSPAVLQLHSAPPR